MKKLNFKSILLTAVAVFGFGACTMAQTTFEQTGLTDNLSDDYGLEFMAVYGMEGCGWDNDVKLLQCTRAHNLSTYPYTFMQFDAKYPMLIKTKKGDIVMSSEWDSLGITLEMYSNDEKGYLLKEINSFMDEPDTVYVLKNSTDSVGFIEFDGVLYQNGEYGYLGDCSMKLSWNNAEGGRDYNIINVRFEWECASFLDIDDKNAVQTGIYPNPTDGTFVIEAENITNVEIFDLAGQKVLTDRSGNRTINAGSLPTGVYFLKVETQNGTKYGKLIKK